MPNKGHDTMPAVSRGGGCLGTIGDVSGPLGSRRQEHPRHGRERLQRRAGRIEETSSVKMIALHVARRGSIFDGLHDIHQTVWREPERGRCRLRSSSRTCAIFNAPSGGRPFANGAPSA